MLNESAMKLPFLTNLAALAAIPVLCFSTSIAAPAPTTTTNTPSAPATPASAAPKEVPSLSVQELLYGTASDGKTRNLVETLSVDVLSTFKSTTIYTVDCYFFSKPGPHDAEVLNDMVTFELNSQRFPALPIQVAALSIALPPIPKPAISKGKPKPTPTPAPLPQRTGYVVRVLSKGDLLTEFYSSDSVKDLVAQNPKLLNKSKARKLNLADQPKN